MDVEIKDKHTHKKQQHKLDIYFGV